MKNIRLVLFLIVFLAICTTSFAQKKITKLSNYAGHDYWIVEKKGLKGLRLDKGKMIVPTGYDLALPSLIEGFSFIIKNGKVGLYDNVNGEEYLSGEPSLKINLFIDKEDNLVLACGDMNGEENISFFVLSRKPDGALLITKDKASIWRTPQKEYFENSIELVDSDFVIHHFTNLPNSNDEDFLTSITLQGTLQKTGVYSLEANDFIISPELYTFEKYGRYNEYEEFEYLDYYTGIKINPTAFDLASPTYNPVINLFKEQNYGLYDLRFKLLVAPQPTDFRFALTGEFFSEGDSLVVYRKDGKVAFSIENAPQFYEMMVYKNFCYLSFMSMDDYMPTLYVYNLKGELLKTELFDMGSFAIGDNIIPITKQDPADSNKSIIGFYDFSKAEYPIPPVYSSIKKLYYNTDLISCEINNCAYYYQLNNNGSFEFVDQNIQPFIPKRAISPDIFLDLLIDEFYVGYEGEVSLELVNNVNEGPDSIKVENKEIELLIYNYHWDQRGELEFYGIIKEQDRRVEIISIYYLSELDKPQYGLRYIDSQRFILPPFFSKMEFNKKNNTLEFTYKGEEGSILLERYEY